MAVSRIQNWTYRNIITYTTLQWNLPIVSDTTLAPQTQQLDTTNNDNSVYYCPDESTCLGSSCCTRKSKYMFVVTDCETDCRILYIGSHSYWFEHPFTLEVLPLSNLAYVYAISVFFTTRLYYNSLKIDLWDLTWQITCYYNWLDGGHCDRTGYRKMAVLNMAGDHGENPWELVIDVMI